MAFDRFMIAPINSGLDKSVRPWLTPDDAFSSLTNAYTFRGRVRKRFGGKYTGVITNPLQAPLFSRVRISLGVTDGGGNANGVVPGIIRKIGQLFSIGDAIYTVYQSGAGPLTMLKTVATPTATFNTTNGNYNFVGAPANTSIFFYPAEPIMGLEQYETGAINNQPAFSFDTQFAYQYSGTSWLRSSTGADPIWTGDNSDFFWVCNWEEPVTALPVMFVTNFNNADPLWSYGNPANQWAIFRPYFMPDGGAAQSGPFVQTCQMIFAFHDALLLVGVTEDDGAGNLTYYKSRCRFSFSSGSPFARNAWYEPNQYDSGGAVVNFNNLAGGGGFIDATTGESVVSGEFIKDRLIINFDRSTWEIAYTGNAQSPFVWQKLNTELGSESTFSCVPFDKVILTIGNTGVHACNGSNVERIDNLIPDEVFYIRNSNEGLTRVVGIRDYVTELVYWTFPNAMATEPFVFTNRVLVYNYRNGTWSFNDDCITQFGYFEQQSFTGSTWEGTLIAWNQANYTWNSGVVQSLYRKVIAGNQQGFIFTVESGNDETGISRNAAVMQIDNIVDTGVEINDFRILQLFITNHTLAVGEYITIENAQGITNITNENMIVQVEDYAPYNANYVYVSFDGIPAGVYTGGGVAARVSNINIQTKQFNPYVEQNYNVFVSKVDFAVQRTAAGQVTVDYSPSSAVDLSMIEDGQDTGAIIGTGILETSPYPDVPLEELQQRLWHGLYFQATGECIQFLIHMNDTQMRTPAITWSNFELEGMTLWTKKTNARM